MKRPILSVVIPAYNVEAYIETAIRSALDQSLMDLEVIVVDDGSSDKTADIVLGIADPRLILIRHEVNKGLSSSRNSGIRMAQGGFIGFLDGDDVWFKDKAERQIAIMQNDPAIGMTYSHSAYLNDDGSPTGQILASPFLEPSLLQMIKRNHTGNGSTPIARREVFEEAGLFDESILNGEEHEMWVRVLNETSFRIRLVPEILTGYRIRRSSLSVNFDHFLINMDKAVDKFERTIPNAPRSAIRHSRADHYRIAARKALSLGRDDLARKYLGQALAFYPWLAIIDSRAAAMVFLIAVQSIIPPKIRPLPYQAIRQILAFYHRRRIEGGSPP